MKVSHEEFHNYKLDAMHERWDMEARIRSLEEFLGAEYIKKSDGRKLHIRKATLEAHSGRQDD